MRQRGCATPKAPQRLARMLATQRRRLGSPYRELRTMSFWEAVWLIVIAFAFIAYLMAMFTIIVDLFRDKSVSGVMKAVWFACLIFFPLITALVYLVVRGGGMAERSARDRRAVSEAENDYIRSVAGSVSPAEQIAEAKRLLDSGAISAAEFDALKSKALG